MCPNFDDLCMNDGSKYLDISSVKIFYNIRNLRLSDKICRFCNFENQLCSSLGLAAFETFLSVCTGSKVTTFTTKRWEFLNHGMLNLTSFRTVILEKVHFLRQNYRFWKIYVAVPTFFYFSDCARRKLFRGNFFRIGSSPSKVCACARYFIFLTISLSSKSEIKQSG